MTGVIQPERPTWVPDELYPFADRYLEIDRNIVHYVDEGTGPPLLLLHGNPSWSFAYRGLIKRLSDRFRCIAPDYPGFGLSSAHGGYDFKPASHARVIEGLVDRLGLEGLTTFGHDWGGPISLWVTGRRPERVRALVIGNTWAWPTTDQSMRFFSALIGGPLSPFLVDRMNFFLNVFLPAGIKRRKLTEQELAAYHGPFPPGKRLPMRILPREIVASRSFLREVESGLSRLADKPTLITWADRDPAFKERERLRFESLFPRHRTVLLGNAGHNLEEDAPDEIAAAIRTWWDEMVEPLAAAAEAEPAVLT